MFMPFPVYGEGLGMGLFLGTRKHGGGRLCVQLHPCAEARYANNHLVQICQLFRQGEMKSSRLRSSDEQQSSRSWIFDLVLNHHNAHRKPFTRGCCSLGKSDFGPDCAMTFHSIGQFVGLCQEVRRGDFENEGGWGESSLFITNIQRSILDRVPPAVKSVSY